MSHVAVPDSPDAPGSAPQGPDPLTAFTALLTEEGGRLLDELRDHDPAQELALATRLRRDHPAALVTAALGQARLRQRARAKFGADDAARMYFTPHGVEQATRTVVAAHRAELFAARDVRRVADLCCGIGGDAVAFARAGLDVLAVDRDPLTCAMARANAEALGLADRIEVRCADVTEVDTADCDAVFADPARRRSTGRRRPGGGEGRGSGSAGGRGGADGRGSGSAGGRGSTRIFDPEGYEPPLSWAVTAARGAPLAALKVAPGIPHETVPPDAEAEWISCDGEVKEAVLWFGFDRDSDAHGRSGTGLRPPGPGAPHGSHRPPYDGRQGPGDGEQRPDTPPVVRATLLPRGRTLTGGTLPDPPAGPVGRYLYEPDGAVIRAHLVAEVAAELDGRLIDPTIAYITADRLIPTPYAVPYEIIDVLPFHLKRLRALLRERSVGTLTVKKRGSPVEPEELRRKVKPQGPHSATVFLTRVAGAPSMLLGHPA